MSVDASGPVLSRICFQDIQAFRFGFEPALGVAVFVNIPIISSRLLNSGDASFKGIQTWSSFCQSKLMPHELDPSSRKPSLKRNLKVIAPPMSASAFYFLQSVVASYYDVVILAISSACGGRFPSLTFSALRLFAIFCQWSCRP
jgi:hypothetical protein